MATAAIVIGIVFVIFLIAAFWNWKRQIRIENEKCTALYPSNSIASLRKRDACITQKALARRSAYG